MRRHHGLAVALVALLLPTAAHAQDAPSLRPHRFTVAGGVSLQGAYDIGERAADLRGNGVGATPPPFTLFTAAGRVARAPGVEARVEFALSRAWAVELAGAMERPRVPVDILNDREAVSVTLPGERLSQYRLEGNVLWHVPASLGRRVRLYVLGGGGYLRQLHEDRTLAESGQVYHGGAGARLWLRGADGARRAAGLRVEARVVNRREGFDFGGQSRTFPAASVLGFFTF